MMIQDYVVTTMFISQPFWTFPRYSYILTLLLMVLVYEVGVLMTHSNLELNLDQCSPIKSTTKPIH